MIGEWNRWGKHRLFFSGGTTITGFGELATRQRGNSRVTQLVPLCMRGSVRHRRGHGENAPTPSRVPRPFVVLAVGFALVLAACSTSAATAEVGTAAEECFLGLDLWDTDPALTWIEDGKVWVRAGDRQACLDFTDASDIWWSPDGRRLVLDDRLFEAGASTALATIPTAQQIVWQQPFGDTIHAVHTDGGVVRVAGERAVHLPNPVSLIASHPDGKHVATVDGSGRVGLSRSDGTAGVDLMQLAAGESPRQMEFAPDGSRLWILTATGSDSQVSYVDLVPISTKLDVEQIDSIVPGMSLPVPELYFVDADLTAPPPTLTTGVGARGIDMTAFVLHPAHTDWVAVTEGRCADADSSLFVAGEVSDADLPGSVVGFFRGGGLPVLATSSAGGDCGVGQLWVVDGLPGDAAVTLVSDNVSSADIRDEAPDPWNPNTAPPFA